MNKLYCTFVGEDQIESKIEELGTHYSILSNKIFVLYIKSTNEYALTYNIDRQVNNSIPSNTILVHRKKESNTLYTINALNILIKTLNGGVVDTKFPIQWIHYKNCILLTNNNDLNSFQTQINPCSRNFNKRGFECERRSFS